MTQGINKVGKGTANDASSITASWTGGGTSASGSTLLAVVSSRDNGSTIVITTPTGWTQRTTQAAQNERTWVYEKVNDSGITGLTVSYTGGTSLSVALDIIELTGTGSYDSNATDKNGTATTTPLTNGITTVAASTILVAIFTAPSGTTTPRTLNAPGTGFTQAQANNQSVGDLTCTTTYCTYEAVTSTQSGTSTQCTANTSTAYHGLLYAYAASAPSFAGDAEDGTTYIHTQVWQKRLKEWWDRKRQLAPVMSRRGMRMQKQYREQLELLRRAG